MFAAIQVQHVMSCLIEKGCRVIGSKRHYAIEKKRLRLYPLKRDWTPGFIQKPKVHPLKIDWSLSSMKPGKMQNDDDESSKKQGCEERHPKMNSLSCKQPTRHRKTKKVFEARKHGTRSVQMFVKEKKGAVESISHNSGKCSDYATFREAEAARCDEVVDSTSQCGSLCSAYTCFCKDSL